MEVVVKENIANKPMHNPPYVLGVIQAPDYHLEPELYSHFKATKEFNQISNDIFEKKQKEKPADRKKLQSEYGVHLGLPHFLCFIK